MKFTVLGCPAPQGSMKAFNRKGGGRPIVTSDNKRTMPWRQQVAGCALAAGVPLLAAGLPVVIRVAFCFDRPASAKKRRYPTVKPDLDKICRSILDALTGIAYVDDAQVVRIEIEKAYSSPSRAEIEIWGI